MDEGILQVIVLQMVLVIVSRIECFGRASAFLTSSAHKMLIGIDVGEFDIGIFCQVKSLIIRIGLKAVFRRFFKIGRI